MICAKAGSKISAWFDRELAEPELGQIGRHLQDCLECRKTSEELQKTAEGMTALRQQPVGEIPPGLLACVRSVPPWWTALVALRGWAPAGLAAGIALGTLVFLFQVSAPLPATLRSDPSAGEYALTPGTTLLARLGETVEVRLAPEEAVIRLEGPGALVVRRAQQGRWREDQRLELDLPSGSAWIQFGPKAPPHRITVTTPQAAIRITGTRVWIRTTPLTTRVEVEEGTAQLRNLATQQSRTLSAGETAEVTAGWMKINPDAAGGKAGGPAKELSGDGSKPSVWYEQE